ncbi:hypothetical protein F5148DRAFT_1009987 [Russula earlei]|uniref:Uncharacterized protein n=1 Tax=Russula earlei TaxID=71964 RepID=A0ACC0UIM7_9AGAM|nr:hypothetical protein F5148DRAFT_1009987 [Russula earlei]
MSNVGFNIDDDHPLALELSSLRTAVARFQHEAHLSSLKLQRHSLEAAVAIERAQSLEHENAAAQAELVALRAHPDSTPRPAELQLPDLTLALRRASDKLTLAEDAFRARTAQFVETQGAASRAHYAAESAFGAAAKAGAREEEALAREHVLMLRLRAAEEEGRMMDRTVREYADLVRTLERRQSLPSSPPTQPLTPPAGVYPPNGQAPELDGRGTLPFESLQECRAELHKLAGEFEVVNEDLMHEIGRLRVDLEGARAELEAEQKATVQERQRLSDALAELERLKHDDNTAAKMVSRYMKFSQVTTDTLQRALESLAARHAATTSTLHTQLASLQAALAIERRQSARLRDVLDEATEQLARETYGRRREIALRLAVVGREDRLAEALRRWVRRAQEMRAREEAPTAQQFSSVVSNAGELLALVDGAASHSEVEATLSAGTGSVARIVVAQDAVRALVEELQIETERRMQLERVLGRAEVDEDGHVVLPASSEPSSTAKSPSVVTEAMPEVVKVDTATSPICPPRPQESIQFITEAVPEDPVSPETPPAGLPVVHSRTELTPVEHFPTIYQPTPRSTQGSPAFLSPHSSPSLSSPANTHSTLPASLPLQDTISASSNELDNDNTRPESPSTPASSISPPSPGHSPSSNLLTEIGKTRNRYDELHRAFRNCHLALRELGQTVQALPPSSLLPISALQTILARLDDFNEDARVELEIRVADEERIARGYATLLSVPGAIASEAEAQDVRQAVRAFVEGSDATVARAQSQFSRKRNDLEHDVAALKLAIHELPQTPSSPPPSSRPVTPAANTLPSWTSLAAGLFASGGSSRPSSPSPTFGAVVTSPHMRRPVPPEVSSLAALQQQLRIPMPELHHHHQGAPLPSPIRPSATPRTGSGMYVLGLGLRGGVVDPGERRRVSVVGIAQGSTSTGLGTTVHEAGEVEVEVE